MRNVLIYFSPQTKQDILRRSCDALGRGGVLMLGAGETPLGMGTQLTRVSSGSVNFYRVGRVPSAVA